MFRLEKRECSSWMLNCSCLIGSSDWLDMQSTINNVQLRQGYFSFIRISSYIQNTDLWGRGIVGSSYMSAMSTWGHTSSNSTCCSVVDIDFYLSNGLNLDYVNNNKISPNIKSVRTVIKLLECFCVIIRPSLFPQNEVVLCPHLIGCNPILMSSEAM